MWQTAIAIERLQLKATYIFGECSICAQKQSEVYINTFLSYVREHASAVSFMEYKRRDYAPKKKKKLSTASKINGSSFTFVSYKYAYALFVNELGIEKTLVPHKAQHVESYSRMMLLTSLLKRLILEN